LGFYRNTNTIENGELVILSFSAVDDEACRESKSQTQLSAASALLDLTCATWMEQPRGRFTGSGEFDWIDLREILQ